MRSQAADVVAISLSGLCLLHCLALPIFISLSPVLGLAGEEWVHGVLAVAAAAVSLFVMATGNMGHNKTAFVSFAVIGMALLISAAFMEALHDYETQATVLGALLLALAHATRWHSHA
ncbi:MAG: MerC domain-containing protein [Pseudomonadota bacterium]